MCGKESAFACLTTHGKEYIFMKNEPLPATFPINVSNAHHHIPLPTNFSCRQIVLKAVAVGDSSNDIYRKVLDLEQCNRTNGVKEANPVLPVGIPAEVFAARHDIKKREIR